MTGRRRPTLSLESKLPLMVGGVMFLVIAGLALASYVEVMSAERSSAAGRLEREAGTTAARLNTAIRGTLAQARIVAAHPDIQTYLRSADAAAREAAGRAMVYRGPRPEILMSVELFDADANPLLAVGPEAGRTSRLSSDALAAAESQGFGQIQTIGDTPIFPAVVPVHSGGTRTGWVVFWWHLDVKFPIEGERVLIGNAGGPVWTSMASVVAPLPVDVPSAMAPIRYHREGSAQLGAAVPVAETPWLVLVEAPERDVLRTARRSMLRITMFAGVLFLLACAGVWLLSRRITMPLRRVTSAATAISGGDYSIRVKDQGHDEVGHLARAFNHMAERVQDAHDRVERQALEHQAAHERLRAIVDEAPVAVYSLDTSGNVRSWNPAAERIFGWSAAEAIGRPLLTAPEDQAIDAATRVREVESGQLAKGIELVRIRKDGGTVTVRVYAGPLHDAAGAVTGIMVVAVDTTELRRMEQQYRHAQRMEAVGRLAGGIAHDFNNLLTVILGETEMALAELGADDPTRPALEEISRAGNRAGQLTRQLLAFSRQQIVESSVFDLNELVLDVERMLDRLIGEDVKLMTRLNPGRLSVRADRGQIEQLLLNLAVNARDAMPDGGLLTIETAAQHLDERDVGVDSPLVPGGYCVLSVNDSGSGMSEEVRSHIFEPFFTTKAPGRGTGLGLAMCYGIVSQAGGDIEVYSEVGVGTSFKIYLPCVLQTEGSSTAAVAPAASAGHERILLVEDQEAVRDIAARMLGALGYQVITAVDAEAALDMLRSVHEPVDLLLTDVILPGMNGGELAKQARALLPGLKVLFASGYTGDVAAYQALIDQNSALIQKPFTVSSLGERVRQVLDQ